MAASGKGSAVNQAPSQQGHEPEREHGFWGSAAGILTAVAAIITGLGGLLAILLQLGVIGGSDDPAAAQPPGPTAGPTAAATTTSGSASTGGSTTGGGTATGGGNGEKPWSQVEAVWTPTQGAQIRMPARTMGFCINEGGGLFLDKRQNVPFEKMKSIDIVHSDVALSPGGVADVRIVLTSGATLTGSIDAGCDFIGNPDTGRVDIYPDRMRRIEFLH
jgi:hypothetical protein